MGFEWWKFDLGRLHFEFPWISGFGFLYYMLLATLLLGFGLFGLLAARRYRRSVLAGGLLLQSLCLAYAAMAEAITPTTLRGQLLALLLLGAGAGQLLLGLRLIPGGAKGEGGA